MESIAKGLRKQFSEDKVYILVTKRNSGYHTYDGIETGGERVCLEVEEEIEAIQARGGNITKLSVVGYSMGGLVARYARGRRGAGGARGGGGGGGGGGAGPGRRAAGGRD